MSEVWRSFVFLLVVGVGGAAFVALCDPAGARAALFGVRRRLVARRMLRERRLLASLRAAGGPTTPAAAR